MLSQVGSPASHRGDTPLLVGGWVLLSPPLLPCPVLLAGCPDSASGEEPLPHLDPPAAQAGEGAAPGSQPISIPHRLLSHPPRHCSRCGEECSTTCRVCCMQCRRRDGRQLVSCHDNTSQQPAYRCLSSALLSSHADTALQSSDSHMLRCVLLVARQASLEGPHLFQPYHLWFQVG